LLIASAFLILGLSGTNTVESAKRPVAKLSVEDRLDIQDTLARYSIAFDNNDWDAFSQVFTYDFVLDVTSSADGQVNTSKGLKTAIERIASLPEYKAGLSDHHTVDMVIWRDKNGVVRSWSHYIVARPDGSTKRGEYLDEWTRTTEGWRINHRIAALRHLYGAEPRGFYGPWWLSGPTGKSVD
jgi:hypothetical protein